MLCLPPLSAHNAFSCHFRRGDLLYDQCCEHTNYRKEHRTRIIPGNGLNPIYAESPFVFRKVCDIDKVCRKKRKKYPHHIKTYEVYDKLVEHDSLIITKSDFIGALSPQILSNVMLIAGGPSRASCDSFRRL